MKKIILTIAVIVLNTVLVWTVLEFYHSRLPHTDFKPQFNHAQMEPHQSPLVLDEAKLLKIKKYVASIPDEFSQQRKKFADKSCSRGMKFANQKFNPDHSYEHDEQLICHETGEIVKTTHIVNNEYHMRDKYEFLGKSKAKFMAVVGCSFTYGTGLEPEQTIAAYLQKENPDYHVYNYGVGGAGPNTLLQNFSKNNNGAYDLVKEKEGIFVYRFLEAQLDRIKCSSTCYQDIGTGIINFPNYELRNGNLIHLGKFSESNSLYSKLLAYIGWSPTFRHYNIKYPSTYSDEVYDLFIALIAELRTQFSKKHQITRSVIIFPGGSEVVFRNLSPRFLEKNFEILDLNNINFNEITENANKIPVDGHPTGRENAAISFILSDYLKKK